MRDTRSFIEDWMAFRQSAILVRGCFVASLDVDRGGNVKDRLVRLPKCHANR